MASTYLTRSITSTNTSWTLSVWVKRSGITSNQYIMSWGGSGTENGIGFGAHDKFMYYSAATGSNPISSALYRDTNAFYHLVVRNNAGTITLYVNGETITNTGGTSGSALNSSTMRIGDWTTGAYHFDGIMSHLYFIDGTAYDASAFGSTDATTGEWKINTAPSVTYGSDGFLILKDGNTITDQSTNSNDFTLGGGTLTNTEDCPSDVFATLNPLVPDTDMTFTHGNTTQQRTSGTWDYSVSTLGADKGKYYFEGKIYGTGHWILGATDEIDGIAELGNGSGDFGYRNSGGVKSLGVDEGNPYSTYTSSDVISIAMDLDNRKIYSAKNGVWENSGDPTSGATGTGAYDLLATSTYFFGACCYITSGTSGWYCNFGNGYFGTTAISSEGTNASGIGKFEYDVPTGYTALSTKGLNS